MSRRKSSVVKVKRPAFGALALLIAVAISGCSLFGNTSPKSYDQSAVEATIQSLAEAAINQDIEAISRHLAQTLQISADTTAPALSPLGKSTTVETLTALWSEGSSNHVDVNVTHIYVQGNTAHVTGSVFVDYTDATTSVRNACTIVGEASLNNEGGRWVVSEVIVSEQNCVTTDPDDDPGTDPGDDPGDEPGNEPGDNDYYFEQCYYMTVGFQGEQAAALQEVLKSMGYYTGRIDGDYGPMTRDAVRKFQADHGLYVDGEFGPKSRAVLHDILARNGGGFVCGSEIDGAGPTTLTRTALRAGTAFESPVFIYESPNPGPTLMFVGCIHGNERSGHLALREAIDRGITISNGRLVIVPEFNAIACDQNRRTMNYSGSAYNGRDFNRMFPVGSEPTYAIAKEMWALIKEQPNLAFVADFHDGFINSLGNTLIHSRQSEASTVARKIRDELNKIRPKGARGPVWRAFTEPIGGSLTRKVGRDLGIPAMEVEISGRNPGDPLALRKQYAWTVMRTMGAHYGMMIAF